MKPTFNRQFVVRLPLSKVASIAIGLSLLFVLICPQVTSATQSDDLAAVWERVRESGVYSFSADVKQITMPQSTVRNVGRASET